MFTEINKKFRNYYKCVKELDDKLCNTEWEDEWDCTCDDRCPNVIQQCLHIKVKI